MGKEYNIDLSELRKELMDGLAALRKELALDAQNEGNANRLCTMCLLCGPQEGGTVQYGTDSFPRSNRIYCNRYRKKLPISYAEKCPVFTTKNKI